MEKKAFIIVGLGFGDEGKGLATDYLCRQSSNPIVIRFNGGQQAGHTVVTKAGERHVFSCFGAGTFRNAPTYWSRFCTFSPEAVWNEYLTLDRHPTLFVDRSCPVTTHYDILYNRAIESTRGALRHGSCGMGFGSTIERHTIEELKLFAQDLQSPVLVDSKLRKIREYYHHKINAETRFNFNQFNHDSEDEQFKKYLHKLSSLSRKNVIQLVHENEVLHDNSKWDSYVFEGAQGILLDMNSIFYPHVTRSNTTSKNAIEILNTCLPNSIYTEVFYITRCYQTRHGEGPFLNLKSSELPLSNLNKETNQFNEYQGEFKRNYLDIDLLNYALEYDSAFASKLPKNLLVTCLDQLISSDFFCYRDGNTIKTTYDMLHTMLNAEFRSCYYSFSDCSDNLSLRKTINKGQI